MEDNASTSEPRRNRVTAKLRWLLFNAGTVLFVCMFLPAIENCGEPIYPVEFIQHPASWPLLFPYFLGLVAAVVAIKWLFFPGSSARRWQIATIVLAAGCYLGAIALYTLAVVEDPWIAAIPMALCYLLLIPAFRVFKRRAPLDWRFARAVWLGGVVCAIHFGLFVVMGLTGPEEDGDSVLFGMWVSLAASLALAVAGVRLEQAGEQPPPPDPAPLPPARALKGK